MIFRFRGKRTELAEKASLKRNYNCMRARVFRGVATITRACSKGLIAADPFLQDDESLKEAQTSENDG